MLESSPSASSQGHFRVQVLGNTSTPVVAPPGYRIVQVNTPSAKQVADLASYRRDFETAKEFLDMYVERFPSITGNYRVSEDALWMAAITAYGRAFNGGVRHAAHANPELYSDSQLETHTRALAMRNKYVAHSVNDFEVTTVIAYLTASAFAKRAVTRTGQQHAGVARLSQEEATELSALCDVQVRDLNRQLRSAHRQVAKELAEEGLDVTYARADFSTPPIGKGDPEHRRR